MSRIDDDLWNEEVMELQIDALRRQQRAAARRKRDLAPLVREEDEHAIASAAEPQENQW